MGSNDNATTITITSPFSIRNYVLGARKQDIHNNWPFHEKYLEVCVQRGINKLLPPFETSDSVRYSSYRENVQSSCVREEDAHIGSNDISCVEIDRGEELVKVGTSLCIDEAVSEITKHMSPLSLSTIKHKHDDSDLSSDIDLHPIDMKVHTSTLKSSFDCHTDRCLSAVPSAKTLSKKRKKLKGKHKMRSMADIYAEASPCTLEDFANMNGSNSAAVSRRMPLGCGQGAIESEKIVHEINGSTTNLDRGYRHRPAESLKMKQPIDGNKKKSEYLGENKKILKIKFSGCKSKAQHRKAIS